MEQTATKKATTQSAQLESFLLMLRGQKTRSEAHQLIFLLTDNPARTKKEDRQLDVLLKAERAKIAAKKAALAATNLLNSKSADERKKRNHRLIQQGLLIELAGLSDWDRSVVLGGLITLVNTKIENRMGWKELGDSLLLPKEKTPQAAATPAAPVASVVTPAPVASTVTPEPAAPAYRAKRVAAVATVFSKDAYNDREEVRALGAGFDKEIKKWFVPAGLDLVPFEKWL